MNQWSQTQVLYLLGAGLAAAVGQIDVTLAYSFAAAKRYFYFHICIYNFHSNTWIYSIWRISRFLCTLGYVVIIGASYYMFEKHAETPK